MKRILCIISSLDAGGAETFLMKIYRVLSPDEYQFDFVVSVDGGCYTQEVLDRGGRIYSVPLRTKNLVGVIKEIKRIVKENKYDIVLKLGENSLSVVDLIAARLGGAKRLAVRACNAPTKVPMVKKIVHAMVRPLLNGVATVKIAPSKLAADFMFGKRASNVYILHNGVDLNVFRYDEEARNRIIEEFSLEDKLIVGHVGRFHIQKNHQYLLRVFAELRKLKKDAVLMLVGIGDLENEIRNLAFELGIEDAVVFTGQRFDIPQLLSAMDVFIFPSFHEGMPNTVIEAQATGLPCVIADTITKEADITGLVQYFSIEESPNVWASAALEMFGKERIDTSGLFLQSGYDIKGVAKEFLELLGC